MENTTATIFGDFYLVNERSYLDKNYVRVDAHELAHQWFGDMITARSGTHHWLQESFATHYDMMYQNEAFGKDHFDWVRRDYNDQAIAETTKDLKPVAHSAAGTVRHYPKGAFVLQMLKDVVGRDQFNVAIKYYLEKHAYSNVDTDDLLVAFHESLGLSLNWFWEEWIYKGGEPSYKVDFEQKGTLAYFDVKQVQKQNNLVGLFDMPITFTIQFKGGSALNKTVRIDKQSQRLSINIPEGEEISFVLFDPNNRVMKSVDFNKSQKMLLAQAAGAEHMLDRYDAIVALSTMEFEGKEVFFMERFEKETFHGIKSEIITLILPLLNENSSKLAALGINDSDVKVRKAVLNNTLRIPVNLEPEYRKLLKDSSYQVIEKTLELLAFYFPGNHVEYIKITADEIGNRSHNVRIANLKVRLIQSADEAAWKELKTYTSVSYEFLTRIKAAKALMLSLIHI